MRGMQFLRSALWPTRRGVLAVLIGLLVAVILYWQWPIRPRMTLKLKGGGGDSIFSPDCKHLATAMQDLRMWDLTTGQERPVPQGKLARGSMAFAPDGKTAAGHFQPGKIIVWEVHSGRELETFSRKPDAVVFSAEGKLLAVNWETAAQDIPDIRVSDIRVADVRTGKQVALIQAVRLRWSHFPYGLATVVDPSFQFWDLSSGKLKLEAPNPFPPMDPKTDGSTREALLLDHKTILATHTTNHRKVVILLWDGQSWQERVHTSYFGAILLSVAPDGTILAVGGQDRGRKTSWWKTLLGRLGFTFAAQKEGFEYDVSLFDLRDGTELATIPDARGPQFSPDGKTLAVRLEDGVVQLWDIPFPRRPWLVIVVAGIVAAGAVRVLWGSKRALAVLEIPGSVGGASETRSPG